MNDAELASLAKEAATHSYSPFSRVSVGAALEMSDGSIYQGCNIENTSFSLTICAERTAIFKAVSEGVKQIRRVAVWSDTGLHLFPCGACLQVLAEFIEPEGKVILVRKDGDRKVLPFKELLPHDLTDLRDHMK